MKAFIHLLLGHKKLAAVLLLASLVVAGVSAARIQVRFQYRDFYDYPGNSSLPLFEQYNRDFGDPAGYVILLLETKDVFRQDVLQYIRKCTEELEPDDHFVRVRSLSNARLVHGMGDDVSAGVLMPDIPDTPDKLAEARRLALGSSLLRRRLISEDGTTTAILAEMRRPAAVATVPEQYDAIKAMQAVLDRNPAPAGVHARITGAPVVEVGTTRSLLYDQLVLMPGVLLVLIIALYATFRSIHGILLPLGAVTVALVWTLGVFALFKRPVDIIGSVIPTTLLVYGVVDPIFVLTRYLLKLDQGRSREGAIAESMSELLLPCSLTSFTTALGFAAFATATLPTIRYFGIAVAIGVTFALVTTLTVLPLLLAVTPAPKVRFTALRSSQRLDAILRAVWAAIRGRLRTVMVATVVLFAVGGYLVREQHIVNVYVRALPRGEALAGALVLEQKLSGVVRIIVYLEGEPGVMKQPDVIRAIDAVDRFAERQPGVTSSVSLADLIAEENQAFNGGDPAEHKVVASRSLIAQYLAIVDPQDRSEFVSDDFAKSHIPILVEDMGSEKLAVLRDRIEREAERAFAGLAVKARMTGNGVIVYKECDQIVIEVLQGFVVAFAIIVALEWLMLRSLRIALISVVPNAVPVLVCFLTMRLLGLDLRIDNSLVLCISIGGLFNTTIHLAARILQRVRAGGSNPDDIVEHSMTLIGPPSFLTAAILSLGFAVLMLSSFPGLQALGVLSMVTLMTAFVSDMVITSAMMRLFFAWPRAASSAAHDVGLALPPPTGSTGQS